MYELTIVSDSRFGKAHNQMTLDIICWYHFVAHRAPYVCQLQTEIQNVSFKQSAIE